MIYLVFAIINPILISLIHFLQYIQSSCNRNLRIRCLFTTEKKYILLYCIGVQKFAPKPFINFKACSKEPKCKARMQGGQKVLLHTRRQIRFEFLMANYHARIFKIVPKKVMPKM